MRLRLLIRQRQPLVVARNVDAAISGTIIFIRNNPSQQTFWGRIQCDENNFLGITNHLIFFNNNFLETVTLEEIKLNTRVTFIVQNYQSTINNIDKKAKSIKFEPNEKKTDVIETVDTVEKR